MAATADPERPEGDTSRSDRSRGSDPPENPSRSETPFSGLHSDEPAATSAAAAASLLREARTLLAENEELAAASKELRKAVKSNPLGAVAIAFATGFILALLARG
jgi:hypothetical protein